MRRPFQNRTFSSHRVFLALVIAFACSAATAAEPWRLQDQFDAPSWLSVSGSYRLRYEWLNNTFRPADPGTDTLLLSRFRFAAEARANDTFRFGAELQDSRAWGAESATPLGIDDVNAVEPLQLYLGIRGQSWLVDGDSLDIRLGRFTMGMGSNRFIGRHIYRNTQNGSSGVSAIWRPQEGPRVEAFVTNPVVHLPNRRPSVDDNDIRLDEATSTVFWGAFVDQLDVAGNAAEFYVFGLDESDNRQQQTRNRDFVTIGARLFDNRGPWLWEVESAYQFGDSRATSNPADTTDLDHSAWLLHADIGHQFEGTWRPRVELRYDYASGDDRPDDGDNERFDSLYGPLRFDYGPTGIYNAVGRSNSDTLGLYVVLTPADDMNWMLGYRTARLASDRDSFGNSGVRDVNGLSGSFIGQQIETRFRWEIAPGNLRFEAGGAVLFKGEFLEEAPNAPAPDDTLYLYAQFLTWF